MDRINHLYVFPSSKLRDISSQLDFLATNMAFFGSRDADEKLNHVSGPDERRAVCDERDNGGHGPSDKETVRCSSAH